MARKRSVNRGDPEYVQRKRSKHNDREKRRVRGIAAAFAILREQLSVMGYGDQRSQLAVLGQTVHMVQDLSHTIEILQQSIPTTTTIGTYEAAAHREGSWQSLHHMTNEQQQYEPTLSKQYEETLMSCQYGHHLSSQQEEEAAGSSGEDDSSSTGGSNSCDAFSAEVDYYGEDEEQLSSNAQLMTCLALLTDGGRVDDGTLSQLSSDTTEDFFPL